MIQLRVISLGAGLQSTVLTLMAARGEINADCAIFADTGWEPEEVYQHLLWLETEVAHFPIFRCSVGNLKLDLVEAAATNGRLSNPPLMTVDENGKIGRLMRGCSRDYKVHAIERKIRVLLQRRAIRATEPIVEQMLGITTDEASRMTVSKIPWSVLTYPLIDLGMSRDDCERWLADRGYPPAPKSACLGCPYRSDDLWRHVRDTSPDEWAETIAIDELIRSGVKGTTGKLYLHRSGKPLEQAIGPDSNAKLHAEEECAGVCFV